MPIIVKAKKGEDNSGLIRKFKKFLQIDDVVTLVRDRRYHKPKAVLRKEQKTELKKRLRREKTLQRRQRA
jgi:ribosomal protein S21